MALSGAGRNETQIFGMEDSITAKLKAERLHVVYYYFSTGCQSFGSFPRQNLIEYATIMKVCGIIRGIRIRRRKRTFFTNSHEFIGQVCGAEAA